MAGLIDANGQPQVGCQGRRKLLPIVATYDCKPGSL
jgi:hypothetical protein